MSWKLSRILPGAWLMLGLPGTAEAHTFGAAGSPVAVAGTCLLAGV